MRQYHAIKQQVPNALLMFRLGDFYELFFEDAVTAARELEITLTSRNKEKGQAIPMCGVPYHAADGYIARLIRKGYRVAICDQMEDAGPGKKLVRREVTRVVTPGTATESPLLRSHENNYLAAVLPISGDARPASPMWMFRPASFAPPRSTLDEVTAALESIDAREVLMPTGTLGWRWPCLRDRRSKTGCSAPIMRTRSPARTFPSAVARWLRTRRTSRWRYRRRARCCIIFATRSAPRWIIWIGRVITTAPKHGAGCGHGAQSGTGGAAVRGRERRKSTLIHVLDQTCTGMGGRLLRQRLLRPCVRAAKRSKRGWMRWAS